MKKLMVTAVMAVALLAVPAVVRGHEGHAHKVMGTISSVEGNHVMVKTTDGKTVMVMLDAKTKITRGKESITTTALKVGERVVAEGAEAKGTVTASRLQVAAALKQKAASSSGTNTGAR